MYRFAHFCVCLGQYSATLWKFTLEEFFCLFVCVYCSSYLLALLSQFEKEYCPLCLAVVYGVGSSWKISYIFVFGLLQLYPSSKYLDYFNFLLILSTHCESFSHLERVFKILHLFCQVCLEDLRKRRAGQRDRGVERTTTRGDVTGLEAAKQSVNGLSTRMLPRGVIWVQSYFSFSVHTYYATHPHLTALQASGVTGVP